MRKKKSLDIETGYLKESSLGSIKIMHKLLGDIIVDHSVTDSGKKNSSNILNIDDKK